MPDLDDVRRFLTDEHGLAVVSTVQSDGRVLSSVVNAGVTLNPATGAATVGFVSAGSSARLAHVRRGSPITVTVRRGWRWVGVTGPATLIGPDDAIVGVDVPALLRDVFRSAGGTHDDWDEYDRVMAVERRTAVFIEPARIIGNP
jgi:PPOX class probable F420-dependent enzyme